MKKFIAALLGFSGFKGPFGALAPAYTISFELLYYAIWGLAMKAAAGRSRRALLIAAAVGVVLIVFGGRLRDSLGWFAGFVPIVGIAVFPDGCSAPRWPRRRAADQGGARHSDLGDVARVRLGLRVWRRRVQPADRCHDQRVRSVAYFTIMSVLFLTVVATWLARPDPAPRASDTWLGEMSYPLFLMHGPAIIGVQFALNAAGIHLTFAANLAILLAASFAAAMLMVTFVERPVMAWRRQGRRLASQPG